MRTVIRSVIKNHPSHQKKKKSKKKKKKKKKKRSKRACRAHFFPLSRPFFFFFPIPQSINQSIMAAPPISMLSDSETAHSVAVLESAIAARYNSAESVAAAFPDIEARLLTVLLAPINKYVFFFFFSCILVGFWGFFLRLLGVFLVFFRVILVYFGGFF
jgi:hypothetical protein